MREIIIQKPDQNLLSLLQEMSVNISAACGGAGKCGKCRVQIRKGSGAASYFPVSDYEKEVFTEEELENGWRLACMQKSCEGMTVCVEEEADMHVETGFGGASGDAGEDSAQGEPVIAIDIGTTTLAAALVDTGTGRILKTASLINRQRRWGADVISRINASNKGNGEALRQSIEEDIRTLTEMLDANGEDIPVIISGNTTMEHLLLGLSCEGLGVAPYTPVDISLHQYGRMTILPGVSTYVGADIVSGIIACGMDEKEEISLLVDLGTNGEMAMGNRDRILVTSTAAGPAFEGGNISCGMAGVPGAVDSVEISNGAASCTTIGGEPARGLCGSGVLETVYELLRDGLMDETGLLGDPYFDEGFAVADGVVFTQQDIREVQLAKAAVRAGIETLAECYGADPADISHLYLAGGFGRKINVDKAAGIGLLPEELAGRTTAVGNSSLAGAVLLAKDPSMKERFVCVAERSEEVRLAETAEFTEHYMDAMYFE